MHVLHLPACQNVCLYERKSNGGVTSAVGGGVGGGDNNKTGRKPSANLQHPVTTDQLLLDSAPYRADRRCSTVSAPPVQKDKHASCFSRTRELNTSRCHRQTINLLTEIERYRGRHSFMVLSTSTAHTSIQCFNLNTAPHCTHAHHCTCCTSACGPLVSPQVSVYSSHTSSCLIYEL